MAAYFNQVVNYIAAEENPPRVPARPGRRSHLQPRCSHSYLRANLQKTEQDIAERLQHALDLGELPDGYSPADGARLAIDAMLALGTRARIGTPRGELAARAAAATETVLRQPVHTRSAGD